MDLNESLGREMSKYCTLNHFLKNWSVTFSLFYYEPFKVGHQGQKPTGIDKKINLNIAYPSFQISMFKSLDFQHQSWLL